MNVTQQFVTNAQEHCPLRLLKWTFFNQRVNCQSDGIGVIGDNGGPAVTIPDTVPHSAIPRIEPGDRLDMHACQIDL